MYPSCVTKDLFFVRKIGKMTRFLLDSIDQTTDASVFRIVLHIGLLMYGS